MPEYVTFSTIVCPNVPSHSSPPAPADRRVVDTSPNLIDDSSWRGFTFAAFFFRITKPIGGNPRVSQSDFFNCSANQNRVLITRIPPPLFMYMCDLLFITKLIKKEKTFLLFLTIRHSINKHSTRTFASFICTSGYE